MACSCNAERNNISSHCHINDLNHMSRTYENFILVRDFDNELKEM